LLDGWVVVIEMNEQTVVDGGYVCGAAVARCHAAHVRCERVTCGQTHVV